MFRRVSSFHRGIESLCRSIGCKVTVCQTLKMITLFRTLTQADWFNQGWSREGNFSQTSTLTACKLQTFDIQRARVPLWKNFHPVVNPLLQSGVWQHFECTFCFLKETLFTQDLFSDQSVFIFGNCIYWVQRYVKWLRMQS